MTSNELAYVMGCPLLRATTFLPLLEGAMKEFGIDRAQALYLASMGHETMGLQYMTELGPREYFSKYDGRADLGNTQPDDGYRFRGRGGIQITGRENYVEVSKALGYDYVEDPDQLAQPRDAMRSAAWWYTSHHCQAYAVRDGNMVENFLAVNRIINLGNAASIRMPNGWEDRLARLQRAVTVFPYTPDFSNVRSGVETTAPKGE